MLVLMKRPLLSMAEAQVRRQAGAPNSGRCVCSSSVGSSGGGATSMRQLSQGLNSLSEAYKPFNKDPVQSLHNPLTRSFEHGSSVL